MMKDCKGMCCKFCAKWKNSSVGLLILRVVIGIIFVAHGWQKFQVMDQWKNFVTIGTEAGGLGLPVFFAYLVPVVEVVAGAAMILGIFTCVAGILLAIQMAYVILQVKAGGALIPGPTNPVGYELDLILLAAALAVVFSGPGKYSLAKMMKIKCGDANCDSCMAK